MVAMNSTSHVVWQHVLALLFALLPIRQCIAAEPASVFTDNMVVQRDRPFSVWGTAEAGERVEVHFGSDRAIVRADADGHWLATLGPMIANREPQSLVIRSGESTYTINNVLVGDVWLCSGQSNMQLTLGESAGGKQFADEHGNNPQIRLLMVPKLFAAELRDAQDGRWKPATPETVLQFSAVGFSFAALLAATPMMHDVPIGLIDSSFGGTAVEGWIPRADLDAFKKSELSSSMFGQPSEHFNAMLRPLVPMTLRGVVWYQGESNSDHPAVYGKLLKQMIGAWRREFRNSNLPFILIQLPAYNAPFQDKFFTWIREQQVTVADTSVGVSLVVTYDTHDGSDLHPREKIPVGARAAQVALASVYGEELIARSPRYVEHSVQGDRVRVRFNVYGEKLETSDGEKSVRGFQLAGSDGEFRFAHGTIVDSDVVRVFVPGISTPKYIRFAWAGVPDANLANSAGLPAVPFRTDRFPPEGVEFVRVPTRRAVRTPRYELELDAAGSLRSLGVKGQQFLANDLGMDGGSCVPTFLGPRNLNQVTEVGPQHLKFCDNEVDVSYQFNFADVRIDVMNHSAAELEFRIALAPEVTYGDVKAASAEDKTLDLSKGLAVIRATGFDDASTSHRNCLRLTARVPAHEARSMRFEAKE